MGHHIKAIILQGEYDKDKAISFDLQGIDLGFNLIMFFVNNYFAACWQAILKTEGLLDINGVDDILFPCEYSLYVFIEQISKIEIPNFCNYFNRLFCWNGISICYRL